MDYKAHFYSEHGVSHGFGTKSDGTSNDRLDIKASNEFYALKQAMMYAKHLGDNLLSNTDGLTTVTLKSLHGPNGLIEQTNLVRKNKSHFNNKDIEDAIKNSFIDNQYVVKVTMLEHVLACAKK